MNMTPKSFESLEDFFKEMVWNLNFCESLEKMLELALLKRLSLDIMSFDDSLVHYAIIREKK